MKGKIITGTCVVLAILMMTTPAAATSDFETVSTSEDWRNAGPYQKVVYGDGYAYTTNVVSNEVFIIKRNIDDGSVVWNTSLGVMDSSNGRVNAIVHNSKDGGVFVGYDGSSADTTGGSIASVTSSGTVEYDKGVYEYNVETLDYHEASNTLGGVVDTDTTPRVYLWDADSLNQKGYYDDQGTDLYEPRIEVIANQEVLTPEADTNNVRIIDMSVDDGGHGTEKSSFSLPNSTERVTDIESDPASNNYFVTTDENQIHETSSTSVLNSYSIGRELENIKIENSQIIGNGAVEDYIYSYDKSGNANWKWESTTDLIYGFDVTIDDSTGKKTFASSGRDSNNDYYLIQSTEVIEATSLDVSISSNTTEYNTYGTDNFEVNATASFSDGSTQEVSEDSGTTYTYDSNILTQLSPKDAFEANSPGSDTVMVEYSDGNGNTVSDTITVNAEDKTQSVEVSISGQSNSYTTTGAQDFTVDTTRTLYDGTTQTVSTSTDTQYYYNATLLNQLSPFNTFEGNNAGTDTIRGAYTDSFSGTNYDDTISITVQEPKEAQSVELTGLPAEMDEGDTNSLTATVTYDDSSTEDVTLDNQVTYQSSNTTRLTVDTDGNVNALYWGDATVSVEYYDSWFDKTVSDSQTTTILGDPSNLDFNLANNEPRRNNNVSMSATLIYEDGRTQDVSNDINSVTVSSSKPARTVFDFQNNTVRFTESETVTEYRVTMANTYDGVAVSDSENASVKPSRDFHDWQKLNGPAKTFVIFTDWALITIVTTLLLSVIVGVKTGSSGLAMGTFTVTTGIAWTLGLVSIFIPATLLLFQAFSYVALDIELTR